MTQFYPLYKKMAHMKNIFSRFPRYDPFQLAGWPTSLSSHTHNTKSTFIVNPLHLNHHHHHHALADVAEW
jgi:hypothetical protein